MRSGHNTYPLLLVHQLCLCTSQAPLQGLDGVLTLHQAGLQLLRLRLQLGDLAEQQQSSSRTARHGNNSQQGICFRAALLVVVATGTS